VTKPHTRQDASRKLFSSRNWLILLFYSVRSGHDTYRKNVETPVQSNKIGRAASLHTWKQPKNNCLTTVVIRIGYDFSRGKETLLSCGFPVQEHWWHARAWDAILSFVSQNDLSFFPQWNIDLTNLYITKSLVQRMIFISLVTVKCLEKNLDTTKPHQFYSEHILPVLTFY